YTAFPRLHLKPLGQLSSDFLHPFRSFRSTECLFIIPDYSVACNPLFSVLSTGLSDPGLSDFPASSGSPSGAQRQIRNLQREGSGQKAETGKRGSSFCEPHKLFILFVMQRVFGDHAIHMPPVCGMAV
ncbi:hypothetical protein, partial [uncultured Faecalibaculum sp.]|uniref:hypothetical protein n=1 Tax=uncultured Faecalibaculum sp. TaxID=1729681 RepID=UPI002712034E